MRIEKAAKYDLPRPAAIFYGFSSLLLFPTYLFFNCFVGNLLNLPQNVFCRFLSIEIQLGLLLHGLLVLGCSQTGWLLANCCHVFKQHSHIIYLQTGSLNKSLNKAVIIGGLIGRIISCSCHALRSFFHHVADKSPCLFLMP